MKKIDLNEKLSKKITLIVMICLAVLLIAGVVGAVAGHKVYLNNQQAKITNYSSSSSSSFHMRHDGAMLVYIYSDSETSVDVNEFVEISKGASLKILTVLDKDKQNLGVTSSVLNVSNDEKYFVIVEVASEGNVKKNGYVIEIINEKYYSEDEFVSETIELPNYISIN